jgi:probable F420-dependent oxidoreductase
MSGFGAATPPAFIAAAGRIAEEHALHSIWVPEHVLFFPEYASRYPYSDDGKIPGNPDGVIEPFTALAFLAAQTERIRLGTGICLVPQRSPVYTAKQVADVDFLSGGRLDFGVGVGWLREEFQALGVPWERRAQRTRECIGVMKTLWCDEVSSYKGEFFTLPECLQNPKPVQRPHPPVIFGGESDAALRRVVELGQGWYGFQVTPEQVEERLEKLDLLLADAGRSRDRVQIFVAPPRRGLDADAVRRYEDLGVEQLILPLFARDEDGLRRSAEAAARFA